MSTEKTPLFHKPTIQNDSPTEPDSPIEDSKPKQKRTAGLLSSIANLALACIGAGKFIKFKR